MVATVTNVVMRKSSMLVEENGSGLMIVVKEDVRNPVENVICR